MNKIVEWADYGEHIPLKCNKCEALFSTKNIVRIGARSIFPFSHFDEGFAKTIECDNLGHTIKDLEPYKVAF
jgi:hypothetical protein